MGFFLGFFLGSVFGVFVVFYVINFLFIKFFGADTYKTRILSLLLAIVIVLTLSSINSTDEGLRALGGYLLIKVIAEIIIACVFVLRLDWLKSILFFVYCAIFGYFVAFIISILLMLIGLSSPFSNDTSFINHSSTA